MHSFVIHHILHQLHAYQCPTIFIPIHTSLWISPTYSWIITLYLHVHTYLHTHGSYLHILIHYTYIYVLTYILMDHLYHFTHSHMNMQHVRNIYVELDRKPTSYKVTGTLTVYYLFVNNTPPSQSQSCKCKCGGWCIVLVYGFVGSTCHFLSSILSSLPGFFSTTSLYTPSLFTPPLCTFLHFITPHTSLSIFTLHTLPLLARSFHSRMSIPGPYPGSLVGGGGGGGGDRLMELQDFATREGGGGGGGGSSV